MSSELVAPSESVNAVSGQADWRRVASLEELRRLRRIVCAVEGVDVLLIFAGGEVAAVQDLCTHLGKPIHQGRLMGSTITCPFHGACFDLKTGYAIAGPAVMPLRTFKVRVEEDDVLLDAAPQSAKP